MTEVAGEVADGFFIHPFTTRRYLDEVTLPALLRGRAKAGQTGRTASPSAGPAVLHRRPRPSRRWPPRSRGTKKQIAFYASTPAYRGVLDLHGWGDAAARARPACPSRAAGTRWASLINDDMLHTFSVVGTPEEVGKALREKLGDVVQRATFYTTYEVDPAVWGPARDALRA